MTTTTAPHVLTDAPAPGTPEWNTTITASKVPPMVTLPTGEYAGYGYLTAWEQFEEIKGRYVPEHSDFMLELFQRAHDREQPAIEQWVQLQDNPEHWEVHYQEAWTNPALPYPNYATLDARVHNTETGEDRILEVKSPVIGGQQPGWIMQVIAQHLMSGIPGADLIVWPFSDDQITVHPIALSPALVDKVATDVEKFYALIKADTPPPGGNVEITAAELDNIKALKQAAQEADNAYKAARDALAEKIEQANGKRATCGDERIATMTPGRFSMKRVPEEYADVLEAEELQKVTVKLDEKKLKERYPWVYAAGVGDPYITLARNI